MATKRKPASRTGAAKPKKKSVARAKAAAKKPARVAKPKFQVKVAKKPTKPVIAAKPSAKIVPAKIVPAKIVPAKIVPAKPGVAGKPGPGAKPAKGAALKAKAAKPAPVVRPIGALPPEAVARAVQKAPPIPVRPGRPVARPQRETSSGGAGVSEKDYQEFEQRLLAERQKILKEMGHLENTVLKVNQRDSAGDLSGYSFHMADVGTDAMEREKAFLFASNEGALLREIDEALRKIYSGEYGVCENCNGPITRARLEAMPYARLCLACKESEERASRGAT